MSLKPFLVWLVISSSPAVHNAAMTLAGMVGNRFLQDLVFQIVDKLFDPVITVS